MSARPPLNSNFASYSEAAIPTRQSKSRRLVTAYAYHSFFLMLILTAISAYSIASLPIPWMSTSVAIVAALVIVVQQPGISQLPMVRVFCWLAVWLLFTTLLGVLSLSGTLSMPLFASTSYPVFVFLRILVVIGFISTLILTNQLCRWGWAAEIQRALLVIGFIIALFSIYIYLAQVLGLPEPLRTRRGTSGFGEQSVHYSYAFHRATGTFREPSHLAEWLILPFFISLGRSFTGNWIGFLGSFLMGGVILLTGSLTGILSVVIGYSSAVVFMSTKRLSLVVRSGGFMVAAIVIAVFMFWSIVEQQEREAVGLHNVLIERLEPIFTSGEGMRATNRDYIYEYLADQDVLLWKGTGLGNSNLLFSEYLGIQAVAAFLSLYFNIYFSSGVIGLSLLLCILILPVRKALHLRKESISSDYLFLLSAYLAWLVVFAVHTEELGIMFAICLGLLEHESLRLKYSRQLNRHGTTL